MASTTKGRGKKTSNRPSVRSHLRPWARDALGIGLVVLALLAILGMWFGSAGPVGRGLDWLLHATFGIAAVVFPVLALYWGLILLRGTAEQDRMRMFIGFAIAAVGVLALISLWHGNPRPFGGYDRLSGAAGITGGLASWPLGKLVSGIGVAIVWGGAVLLGLLIFSGTPLSAIWDRIVDAFTREDNEVDEDEDEEDDEEEVAEPRIVHTSDDFALVELPEDDEPEEEPEEIEVPELVRPTGGGPYELPPLELLRTSPPSAGPARAPRSPRAPPPPRRPPGARRARTRRSCARSAARRPRPAPRRRPRPREPRRRPRG